jgi:hypothetical protein
MSWEHSAGIESGPYNRGYGVQFMGTNGTLVADRDNWVVYPEKEKIPEIKVVADYQDHKLHVRNFIECVKTRNFQTACTIENGSLCAKYAHWGNIAARTNRTLEYDDIAKAFKGAPEADRFIRPVYHGAWKFPE